MQDKLLNFLQNIVGFALGTFLVFFIILLVSGKTYSVFPSLKKFDKKPKKELFFKENDSTIIYISTDNDTSIYKKVNLRYDTIHN